MAFESATRSGRHKRALWMSVSRQQLEPLLRTAVRRITATFPTVRRIVLFGSYAGGTPKKDSDLDLFIVMPTRRRWTDRARQLHAIFPERSLPMDFVVRTPQEVQERLTTYFCPFTREVMAKGRVLYEASERRP